MRLASEADLLALEAQGFETVFPQRTPFDIIRAAAEASPQATAIRYLAATDEDRWEDISYAELRARITAAGALFRELGVGPGDSVGLLVAHTVWGQVALWGAQIAGAACPINPMLRPDYILDLLSRAGAKAVVIMGPNPEQDWWSTLLPRLRAAGLEAPVLACDAEGDSPGAAGDFGAMVGARMGGQLPFEVAGDEHATAAWYHTGGTTGAPKLVRHSRLNEAHVGRSCALMHGHRPGDVVLNGFPLFHVAGSLVYGLAAYAAGATLLVPGRLGMRNRAFVGSIWQQVARHRITVLGGVPTTMAAFNAVPIDADISCVRAMLTGGSPLPPELAQAFEERTGVPVRNILGMTECAGAIAVEPVDGPRVPNSCGLRLPYTEIRVVADDGLEAPLRRGETGIIALRGPNVSSGYSDPARNPGTFEQGWLISGDLGRIDAEGRLFVTGRAKDIIIRGGHNIDPQAIEDALLAHPAVLEAAAVGMPDSYAGELPVAFVTAKAPVASEELRAFLETRIDEPAALPKRIELLDEMPLTPIGKIFKPALRRIATRWALEAEVERVGAQGKVEVSETLAATVTVGPEAVQALRAALVSMPADVTVRAAP